MIDMDSHIESPQGREESQTFRCDKCEVEWVVDGNREYGMWGAYDEDDMNCPVCGEKGA